MMTTLKEGSPTLNPGSDYLRGRTVKTSPLPAKHPYFALIKSNNYLPNVLATLDAESENKDYVSPPWTFLLNSCLLQILKLLLVSSKRWGAMFV